jgi:hypothetical protein
MVEKKNYSEVYKVLDPIITENPTINWKKLEEEHEEISKNISYGAFLARKRRLLGDAGYTYGSVLKRKKIKKKKSNTSESIDLELIQSTAKKINISGDTIIEFLKETYPISKNYKEYTELFKIIIEDPTIGYSKLKTDGLVTISGPTYYEYRKKVHAFIRNYKGANGETISQELKTSKIGNIYRTLYYSTGADDEIIAEVSAVIEALRQEKEMFIEVVELKNGYEIREFTK